MHSIYASTTTCDDNAINASKNLNVWRKAKKSLANSKTVQRTLTYLRHAQDITALLAVLRGAFYRLIESISKPAINARKGEIKITPSQDNLFRTYANSVDLFAIRHRSIDEHANIYFYKCATRPIRYAARYPLLDFSFYSKSQYSFQLAPSQFRASF